MCCGRGVSSVDETVEALFIRPTKFLESQDRWRSAIAIKPNEDTKVESLTNRLDARNIAIVYDLK